MRVPFLDLRAQLRGIESEIKAAVHEVIESAQYIGGPVVEQFETAVTGYTGARHAIGVSSGTDALLASLMALGVGRGDLVITTPYSFFATAGVIARLGATPVFVDINPATFNMDPARLAAWFERETARRHQAKAVVPVHLFGQCADMTPILELSSAHGVPVIEDAAQALGARYPTGDGDAAAGTLGTLGCVSFYPTKNLGGMGDGGMVITNDDSLANKLRCLRNHGAYPKYYHATVGGNFRLDPIQAAVLLVKLPHLRSWYAQRQARAAYYDQHFDADGLVTPALAYERHCHTYSQYVIMVPKRRDALRTWLAGHGIDTMVYYPVPFHEQACFKDLGHRRGAFPHSEHAARQSLALPVYPELTTAMQDHVIERIGAFYG